MSITKTKNGTYRLRIYIPEEARSSLGIDKKVIEKRFKLRSEAKKYELELQNKIDSILSGAVTSNHEITGSIQFKDFYKNVWWNPIKQVKPLPQQNHLQKPLLVELRLSLGNISYQYLEIIQLISSIKTNKLF